MTHHKICTTDFIKEKFKVDKNFISRVLDKMLPFLNSFNSKLGTQFTEDDLKRISEEHCISEDLSDYQFLLDGVDFRISSKSTKDISSLFSGFFIFY
jgi:hypothetical protein